MYIQPLSVVIGSINAGPAFVGATAAAANALDVTNNTGYDIEYRRGGAGDAFPILAGQSRLIVGISNANEIAFRRIDLGTAVAIKYEVITL